LLASVFLLPVGPARASAPRSTPALSAFELALAPVTAYSATITVMEQKDRGELTTVGKYTFRKPSTVTLDVVGGPNDGATLLWTGGETVNVHRGTGLAGLFGKTVSLHDPLVTTSRGSSIDEISFERILEHGRAIAGSITEEPGPTIGDQATVAVTLTPADASTDSGYTREVIQIGTATHFPLRVLGYEGTTLVRKIEFADVKVTR
jgi:outer membrane lipoprotein-sorting protein